MATWIAGRKRLSDKTRRDEVPLEFLVENLAKKKPTIVPGTAVFLTGDPFRVADVVVEDNLVEIRGKVGEDRRAQKERHRGRHGRAVRAQVAQQPAHQLAVVGALLDFVLGVIPFAHASSISFSSNWRRCMSA